jgi:hypothetical protein
MRNGPTGKERTPRTVSCSFPILGGEGAMFCCRHYRKAETFRGYGIVLRNITNQPLQVV